MMKDYQDIWKKEFDELNAQEREYVSEWCETPEDYDMVRNFMLQLSKVDKQPVEPSKELKAQLMAEFPSTQRNRGIWLNLWLMIFPEDGGMNWKPILVTAMLIGVIVTVVFFQNPFSENKNQQLAENQMKEEIQDERNTASEDEVENELKDLKSSKEEETEQSPQTTETIDINEERSNNENEKGEEQPVVTNNLNSLNEETYLFDKDESPGAGDGAQNRQVDDIDVTSDSEMEANEMSPGEDQLKKQSDFKRSESDKSDLVEIKEKEEKEKKDFSFFSSSRKAKTKSSAPLIGGSEDVGGNVATANEPAGNSSVMQVNNAQKNKDLNSLLFTTY